VVFRCVQTGHLTHRTPELLQFCEHKCLRKLTGVRDSTCRQQTRRAEVAGYLKLPFWECGVLEWAWK